MSSVSALNSLLSSGSDSTSSINLSQILEAATGASSEGIDVNSAVSAAVTAAEGPEQTWESQETTLENQASALNQLQTDATNLDNDVQSLNNLTGPLSATTVTSSNSDVLSATAASGAASGTHVVQVSSLASTASWTSGTFASGSTALPAGSFTITTGSGPSTTITTDGTQTLSDVASKINSDNLGLTASIVTDASGSRLAILADSTGSAANFTIGSSSSSGFGFTQAVTGANASLTVDGIAISSPSNTVTGVIPGLTLSLLSADPGAYVSLGVSPDTSQASTAINQFVSDYNTLVTAVNTQYTDTGSGEGVLATDANVRNLQSDLQGVLGYVNTPASGTTTVSTLGALGISVNTDGTLSVDSATLGSALSNNFSDVQTFFQGAALNGFANSMDQQLTNFISPSDGAFTLDLQSIGTQETGLQTDISNFQANVITPLKAQLTNEYSQAEILLQQLPTEMKQIAEELGENNSSS
jgi:flagellar hook-associated protein 2